MKRYFVIFLAYNKTNTVFWQYAECNIVTSGEYFNRKKIIEENEEDLYNEHQVKHTVRILNFLELNKTDFEEYLREI